MQLAGRYLEMAEQHGMNDMVAALSDLLEAFDVDDPVHIPFSDIFCFFVCLFFVCLFFRWVGWLVRGVFNHYYRHIFPQGNLVVSPMENQLRQSRASQPISVFFF